MLTLILTAVLSCAVVVMVVSPLVWAILTQHRDQPAAGGTAGDTRSAAARVRRGGRPRGTRRPTTVPS
jgi:hypothetical protein